MSTVRAASPLAARAPRLPPARYRRRCGEPDALLHGRPGGRRIRPRDRAGHPAASGQPAISVSHRARCAQRRARDFASCQRPGVGLPALVLSLEQHPGRPRGGLLGQGSILTITSYANRTSPVNRGKWVLENLLSSAPPPPPANVPALKTEAHDTGKTLTMREAMIRHRADPACCSCH